MMTVHWPNGVRAVYSDADWITWAPGPNGYHKLFNGDPNKKGDIIARIPGTCAIEFEQACHVDLNAVIQPPMTMSAALEITAKSIRSYTDWKNIDHLRSIKAALRDFDSRTGAWK